MFIVDSAGKALGSPRIRISHIARPGTAHTVRVVHAGQVQYETRVSDYEAFFFAYGRILRGASEAMLVSR